MTLRSAALLCLFLAAAGCGQKGPLFLPGDPNQGRIVLPGELGGEEQDEGAEAPGEAPADADEPSQAPNAEAPAQDDSEGPGPREETPQEDDGDQNDE